MFFDILFCVLAVVIVVLTSLALKKQNQNEEHIVKLAMKVAELEETIHRVDESTGQELNRIGVELRDYQQLYGEAAVEEIRERTKNEKKFAKGLESIMNFGAQYQSKGE